MPDPLANAVTFAGQPALVLQASRDRAHRDRSPAAGRRGPARPADRRGGRRARLDGQRRLQADAHVELGLPPALLRRAGHRVPGRGLRVRLVPSSGRCCCWAARPRPPPPRIGPWRWPRRSTRSWRTPQAKPPAFELRERPQPGGRRRGRGAHVPRAHARGRRGLLEELGDRARRGPARGPGRRGPPLGGAAAGLLRPVPLPAAAAAGSPRSRRAARCSPRSTARPTGARRAATTCRRASCCPTPAEHGDRACGSRRSWSRATPGARRWRSRAAGTGRWRTRTSASARFQVQHAHGGRPPRRHAHHLARLDRAQVAAAGDRLRARQRAASPPTCRAPRTASRARSRTTPSPARSSAPARPPVPFTLQFVE